MVDAPDEQQDQGKDGPAPPSAPPTVAASGTGKSTAGEPPKPKTPPPLEKQSANNGPAAPSPAPKVAAAEPEKPSAAEKPSPKKPPVLDNAVAAAPVKRSRWPVFLVLLIALGAAGGAGYTWWQLQLLQSSLQGQEGQLRALAQSATASLADRVSMLDASVRRQQDDVKLSSAAQQAAVDQLMARVGSANRRISEITNVSRQSWMLAEAEYLLRLANQRLVVEQAVQSSLALLQAADRILLQVDDVNLFEVRGVLAKEISSLQAVGQFDVEGVYLQLSALAEQSAELALLMPDQQSGGEGASEQSGSGASATAGDYVESALQGLFDLVQIRHRDVPIQPLLTPEQHYYVQQNLRLMLEQAQLALLQRRQPLFEESLAKAAGWVEDYFQLNPAAQSVIARLEELQQLNVAAPLPDISVSLGLLKGYLSNPEQPVSLPESGHESDAVEGDAAGTEVSAAVVGQRVNAARLAQAAAEAEL